MREFLSRSFIMRTKILHNFEYAEDSDVPLIPSCRPLHLAQPEFPEYRQLPRQVLPCVQQLTHTPNRIIAFEYHKLQMVRSQRVKRVNVGTDIPVFDQLVNYSDAQIVAHEQLHHVPYAFIRLANEELTLRACLASLEGIITKGIIAYHEPLPGTVIDNSLVIAQEFIARNPGFKLVKYELPVLPNNSSWVAASIVDPEQQPQLRGWLLDSFYNFALDQAIAWAQEQGDYEHAFLIKIDGDHVYSPTLLRHLLNESKILFYRYGVECLSAAKVNVSLDYRHVVRNTYDAQIFSAAQEQALESATRDYPVAQEQAMPETSGSPAAVRLRTALRTCHLLHLASKGLAPTLLAEVACHSDHQIIYLPMHNRFRFTLSVPRDYEQHEWHDLVRNNRIFSWELLLPPSNLVHNFHTYQHLTSTHWCNEKRNLTSLENLIQVAHSMEQNPQYQSFKLGKPYLDSLLASYTQDEQFFRWESLAQQSRQFNYALYLPLYLTEALLALHELGWQQTPTWQDLEAELQGELHELLHQATWSKVTQPCGMGRACGRLQPNPSLSSQLGLGNGLTAVVSTSEVVGVQALSSVTDSMIGSSTSLDYAQLLQLRSLLCNTQVVDAQGVPHALDVQALTSHSSYRPETWHEQLRQIVAGEVTASVISPSQARQDLAILERMMREEWQRTLYYRYQ